MKDNLWEDDLTPDNDEDPAPTRRRSRRRAAPPQDTNGSGKRKRTGKPPKIDPEAVIAALLLAIIFGGSIATAVQDSWVGRITSHITHTVNDASHVVIDHAPPAVRRSLPTGDAATTDLAALTVAPEHPTGYQRTLFGQRWKDTDHDGCDQRNDVLARDMTSVRRSPARHGPCIVLEGTLTDPYTGTVIHFAKADADAVQIDHRVALAEAWASGAYAWTPTQRQDYANDLGNLVATSRHVNISKSDKDAAGWLPAGPARQCVFAHDVIATKSRWDLTVDPAERSALARALDACPQQ